MTQSPLSPYRALVGAVVVGFPLVIGSLVSCDKLGGSVDPGAVAGAAAGCPDLSSVAAVMRVDWAREFGLDAAVAGSVGAGVRAAVQIESFAADIDAKLVGACGGLARDLGQPGTFATGEQACRAAMNAMAAVKARIGGGATLSVAFTPPRCHASLDAMAECVAECDADVEPGAVTVECQSGTLSGVCEAECRGRCDLSGTARCEGTCIGSCDAKFSGTCGGECRGTCDGAAMQGGSCAGRCEGSCSAIAEGSCGGQCSGSCEMSAAAQCEGTCTGECSVQMKAPTCEGAFEPPKARAECNAACEAKVQGELTCRPAEVALIVEGGVDAEAVAMLQTAVRNNLPAVLEIAVGMREQALGVAAHVKAVVGGVQGTIKALGGSASVGARLTACVTAPFKAAYDAAASIQANVSVSVEVQASVSASARGSASGSAG